jgi:nucleoside phosphorylase/tetratricopeptide (TPR) repeat protein
MLATVTEDRARAAALAKRVTVGIVTAMPKEHVAVKAMLDGPVDHGDYVLGEVPAKGGGTHAVALLRSGMGTTLAAAQTAVLLKGMPAIDAVLMVGIAGGVPNPGDAWSHVRLGDVVVSDHRGVIDYGMVVEARKDGEVVTEHRNPPRPPSPRLLVAVEDLVGLEHERKRPWVRLLARGKRLKNSARPGPETDVLAGGAAHPADPARVDGKPRIFQGAIASSGVLLKDPVKRDLLRKMFGVLAYEMEGAGLADAAWVAEVGYLDVRGICDYCDATKGYAWQEYAAIAAAAYARAVLGRMVSKEPGPRDRDEKGGAPNNLRARNPYFRGRGKELADLEAVLGRDGKATITHASVFGLGGVGKTALALELAHRAVDKGLYPGGVWWVAAEGKPVDALVAFAPVLRANAPEEMRAKLPEGETRAEVIAEEVRVALQGQKAASLLVLDDVSEPWGPYIPGGAVRVLLTTRDANIAIGVARRLEVLSKEQGREVADAIAGEPQDKGEGEARDRVVVRELGGLAVAVEMAARAVKKWFNGAWTAYERVLLKEMEKVLEDPMLYGDYGRGVFAAIDLSIDKCDTEARALLEGAAVLAPERMPKAWALEAAGIEAEGLTGVRATAALRELGLLTVGEDKWVVSTHRLVHRRVRARAERDHSEVWNMVSGRGVDCVLTWIEGAVELRQTRVEVEAVDARWDHIDRALRTAERIGNEIAWIRIADRLATHLQNRARYDESLLLFQRVLAKAEKVTPPNPSYIAASLANLAGAHRDLGQPAAARPLFERALALGEVIYGPDHPNVAMLLSNLALAHKDLGQPAAARPLLERALGIDEATHGPDHPTVAIRLSNLAAVHHNLGQPVAARPLLERALAIAEATYGLNHPNVAGYLSNLAMVHKAMRQPAAARPLLKRAIAIAEARLPPNHPDLAIYRKNLANLGPPP